MPNCENCQNEMDTEKARYMSGKLMCGDCAKVEEDRISKEREDYENGPFLNTGLTRKQVNDYLGTSDTASEFYYLKRWEKVSVPEKYAGLNWVALIFTELWMAYRKFYLGLAIFYVAQAALLVSVTVSHLPENVSLWIALAPSIVLRIWAFIQGNAAVYRRMLKRISEEKKGSSWVSVAIIVLFRYGFNKLMPLILAALVK